MLKIQSNSLQALGLKRSKAFEKRILNLQKQDVNGFNEKPEVAKTVSAHYKDRKMISSFSYDILLNDFYNARFGYIPPSIPDRLSYIACENYSKIGDTFHHNEQGDIYEANNDATKLAKKCQSNYVRLALELAYLPENVAKEMTLTTEGVMKYVTDLKEETKKKQEQYD